MHKNTAFDPRGLYFPTVLGKHKPGKINFGIMIHIGHVLPDEQGEAIEMESRADKAIALLFPNHKVEQKKLTDKRSPRFPFTSTQYRCYVYVLVKK